MQEASQSFKIHENRIYRFKHKLSVGVKTLRTVRLDGAMTQTITPAGKQILVWKIWWSNADQTRIQFKSLERLKLNSSSCGHFAA